jgi:ribonuclease BN (tRNA processing enzyme)
MKIKVLGCSGANFPGHNVPGFLLNSEIVFDAGSITSVLNEKAQLKIKNIFITHAHLDHIRGIPFLADNISAGKNRHKFTILSISPVIKTIKRHLFNSSVWPNFTIIPNPCNAILNFLELKAGNSIKLNDYVVTPYRVNHTVPAVGYLVEDTKGKRFFYTGDTGPSHKTWGKIGNKQIHCLIIDVSFPDAMKDMAIKTGHLTPGLLKKELLEMRCTPENIYITHIKPQYFKIIKTELNRLKMKNLKILKDGATIRV